MVRRPLLFSLLLLALMGTGMPANALETERTVIELSGNGSRNTRPFTVSERWELRWDLKTDHFAVHLYTATGERQGMLPIATQDRPGRGATFRPDGGTFYLKIIAKGDWEISVVQLP